MHSGPGTSQLCLMSPADVGHRNLSRGTIPKVCLPSDPTPQTTSLQHSLVWYQEHGFFGWRVGKERKRYGKGREGAGMGNPQTVVRFQEAASGILQSGSRFFQAAFSLRPPTPDTPVPSFGPGPCITASQGKEPRLAAVTALLDKLSRNLHKPQCSRCRGRLEETCFSVGFSLASAANHSWNRKLEKFRWETLFWPVGFPHPPRVQLVGKASSYITPFLRVVLTRR
uniref:Uncharacterized protein n=1 Tax=Pipistrellus kuhlii TaxID=59472 RepID=A0A7J7VMG5_PIPKU|nr:hypothetical protein mPipKuh1_008375 [Pipistrellus kuhlii]